MGFGSEPAFFFDFGVNLAPTWHPKSTNIASKIDLEKHRFFARFWNRFFDDFRPTWAPSWAPSWAHVGHFFGIRRLPRRIPILTEVGAPKRRAGQAFFGGPGGMRGAPGEEKGGVIDPPSYDLQISEGEL